MQSMLLTNICLNLQGQVDEYKKEINLYSEELEAVKKKYFQMKRQ